MPELSPEKALEAARQRLREASSPEAEADALEAVLPLICDEAPAAEQAARLIAAQLRQGRGHTPSLKAGIEAQRQAAAGSAPLLLDGLLGLLGDGEARARLKAALRPERPEVFDGISLDRLLTAISWQRDEALLKAVRALRKRLDDGRIAAGAVGPLQRIGDFVTSQRMVTKAQRQTLEDLRDALEDGPERLARLIQACGASDLADLRQGEARLLTDELTRQHRLARPDSITLKQVSYIRGLMRKLGLDAEAEAVIAQEVGGKPKIAQLTKDEGSSVIEWLLARQPS